MINLVTCVARIFLTLCNWHKSAVKNIDTLKEVVRHLHNLDKEDQKRIGLIK